jgi:hypothetical protein
MDARLLGTGVLGAGYEQVVYCTPAVLTVKPAFHTERYQAVETLLGKEAAAAAARNNVAMLLLNPSQLRRR